MMKMTEIPNCIQKGSGGLRHYKYWTGGVKLLTKRAIVKAMSLNLKILRKDKIMDAIEKFNYHTKQFELINDE